MHADGLQGDGSVVTWGEVPKVLMVLMGYGYYNVPCMLTGCGSWFRRHVGLGPEGVVGSYGVF